MGLGNEFEGSVTRAIVSLGEHDEESAQLLWERFFQRLIAFAETKVFARHRRFFDGEDIAGSAMYAVLDGCLLYTSPSPRDRTRSRMPSSA